MKHPIWIANSSLLLLVVFAILFVVFARIRIPQRTVIEISSPVKNKKREEFEININKIYENDLFGTFHKEIPIYQQPTYKFEIPPAPQEQEFVVPKSPEPTFLEPLNITLKGIMVVGHDEQKNRVIVTDNKTDREHTYKVGDTVEDAQLIRIFNNKILLLRSNGQQEILYLKEYDAKHDPAYTTPDDWHDIIKPTGPYTYTVASHEFITRVENLAQFIDLLGLSTAYEKGMSIGCRIGDLNTQSLGFKLGFATGDIVTRVNTIPTVTTQERLQIYKEITHLEDGGMITVDVQRRGNSLQLHYELRDFKASISGESAEIGKISEKQELEHKKELLGKKHKFAPTIQELRQRERELMIEHKKIPKS